MVFGRKYHIGQEREKSGGRRLHSRSTSYERRRFAAHRPKTFYGHLPSRTPSPSLSLSPSPSLPSPPREVNRAGGVPVGIQSAPARGRWPVDSFAVVSWCSMPTFKVRYASESDSCEVRSISSEISPPRFKPCRFYYGTLSTRYDSTGTFCLFLSANVT